MENPKKWRWLAHSKYRTCIKVSADGQVKRQKNTARSKPIELKQYEGVDTKGNPALLVNLKPQLYKGEPVDVFSVGYLVLLTFVREKPKGSPGVGYRDGNFKNVHVDNLYWLPVKHAKQKTDNTPTLLDQLVNPLPVNIIDERVETKMHFCVYCGETDPKKYYPLIKSCCSECTKKQLTKTGRKELPEQLQIHPMMTNHIKTTKGKVELMLTKKPELRDNDEKLVCNFWYTELLATGLDPRKMTAMDLLNEYSRHNLTPADVITRARRKAQQNNPQLRGLNWEIRQTEAEAVRQGINQ